jgi:ribonuclease VapC
LSPAPHLPEPEPGPGPSLGGSVREQHRREAVDAYLRFGKGRHKARLNFGDCLTYAVARLANEPLLFAGDDFPATDLELA